MNVKVIGTGCEKCDKVYKSVQEGLAELGIEAETEKIEDLVEIVKLGVMTSPSLMIDGKVVSAGKVLKKDEAVKLLKKYK